jgi:hypothetical protein
MAHGDGESHVVREARGRRLRRVEIGVSVEPYDPEVFASHSGNGSDGIIAIAGQHKRKIAGLPAISNLLGDEPIEFESDGDLGGKHAPGLQ